MNMNENVAKFFELYDNDPALRAQIAKAEKEYPGSLEIRDAVVKEILLPIAQQLGLPFTLMDLKVYETKKKLSGHPDRELTEEELNCPDQDGAFFLVDRGWAYDENVFQSGSDDQASPPPSTKQS